MAVYNEILVGRFNRALQKFLQMKGGPPSPQLAGDISAGFTFPLGVEFRYLEQWNRFSLSSGIVEVGGATANKFRLRNPAGSNVIGVVERLVVGSSSAADIFFFTLGPIAGDLTTLFSGQRLDARTQVATGSLIPSSFTSGGADSPQIGSFNGNVANQMYDQIWGENQEITILPGDALGVSQNVVAAGTTLRVWTIWRERFLEESERT